MGNRQKDEEGSTALHTIISTTWHEGYRLFVQECALIAFLSLGSVDPVGS